MDVPAETAVRREFVVVDGTRLSYLVAGDPSAPPVVLLHGGGVDSAAFSWKHTLPALADVARVYAPDWPGYGRSERGTTPATVDGYVDVLDGFLSALDVGPTALVGISMGGGVALGFALARPDRVSRLVLVDSYGLGGTVPGGRLGYWFVRLPFFTKLTWALVRRSRRIAALTLRSVVHPDAVTEEMVDDLFELARRPGAGRTFREFQVHEVGPHGLRTNYVDRLPDVSLPTLLVHGEADPLVPASWAVRAATLLPDATLRLLPNCGHVAPRERPAAVNRYLVDFLASD